MNNPKFQIFKGKDEKFYFRLFARNGEQILSSQGYASKANCQGGIESVKTNAPNTDQFEVKEAANGKFHFNLLAANKQIIASSQMYASKATCQNGISAVQNVAPDAGVEDTTL